MKGFLCPLLIDLNTTENLKNVPKPVEPVVWPADVDL
jgi:hypothetical protein